MTGFAYHPVFLEHRTGPRHPENPQRLAAILRRLEASGLLEKLQCLDFAAAGRDAITAVHAPSYVAELEEQCKAGRMFRPDDDTVGSPDTFTAACMAAGACMAAAEAVMRGSVQNAFCAVRPPGHHALHDRAMGFCFLNNIAITARHLQKAHGLSRIAIIDWDVHHGNGTQDLFRSDPSVFYFSTHQFPFYPGSGRASETGDGPGRGFTLNAPLRSGAGDAEVGRAFHEELHPAMDRFRPEFILVSAGFDGHRDDPLGNLVMTEDGYGAITRQVMDMARKHCADRLVSILEGGYNLEALAASVEAHIKTLMG